MSALANSHRSELGLMSLRDAERAAGMKPTAFWKFRKRHKVPLLSGNQIHRDDLKSAFDRERGISTATAKSTRQ